jgi:hypothetical protein
MACNLSAGRNEPCKESIGGLAGVYFINYASGGFTVSGSLDGSTGALPYVTALPASSSVYYYELKGTSAYTETVNTSRENGTTFFSQELTLNLKKLTNEMTTQLKLMAWGRPQIIVWTQNGDAFLGGFKEGADLTGGTIQTGGAMGDLYGYSATFTGMEQFPAIWISGSNTTTAIPTGVLNNGTIVFGS